ncbi:MAG: FAD-dependent oxidoreductase [Pseudomonadota bacterium]
MAPPALASCGLPDAWADRPAWTVLDTDVRDGQHFVHTWRAWQNDPQRPRMLHYVCIAAAMPGFDGAPALGAHVTAQLAGLGPGFHRILLDRAQVSLTLCLGDESAALAEHVFQADTLFTREPADKWEVQVLARRCKRGTRFWMPAGSTAGLSNLLAAAGFQSDTPTSDATWRSGRFDPRWEIKTSRTSNPHVHHTPARCAVIGAGITGASVAHALARRGWQVTVLDQAAHPATGASGLPVGLAVPHVSADDNPRSRLSRSGIHLLQQHAGQLLVRGQDWDPSGVLERHPDASTLWHGQACWIKPAQLVQAWLAEPGIRFAGNSKVARLRRGNGVWQLQDAAGQSLGGFETVVVANAMGCTALLDGLLSDAPPAFDLQDRLTALQAVHGTLSHGQNAAPITGLPATPINGNGCFIPGIPDTGGTKWFAGSGFITDAQLAADGAAQHLANMERLQQLLPEHGKHLVEALNRGPVALWSSTRCVTHDRLPLVGPIEVESGTGLWLCVGMGARGLSFSALCAELLVARLGAEPLPMEFSLSRSLDVNRPRRRQTVPPEH